MKKVPASRPKISRWPHSTVFTKHGRLNDSCIGVWLAKTALPFSPTRMGDRFRNSLGLKLAGLGEAQLALRERERKELFDFRFLAISRHGQFADQ